jgi:drug/metabolite transporter (DMT)-like permease
MLKKYKYHIVLHVIVLLWGFTGILGKLILLSPLQIVWFRVIIAFVSLYIGLSFLKLPKRISSPSQFWATLGIGVFVALHWYTFYLSIQLSTASLGILCLSTVTLHVSWMEPLFYGKSFSWIEFLLGLAVVFGISIVCNDFNSNEWLALGYGLFSALCIAFISVSNSKLAQSIPAYSITLHEMGIAVLFIGVVLFCKGELNATTFVMRGTDLLWLLFLGIICTSFAFLITIELMKKLGTFTVSLSINLEPVYTIILAIIVLNEHKLLSYKFYLGACVILAVLILNALIKNKRTNSK